MFFLGEITKCSHMHRNTIVIITTINKEIFQLADEDAGEVYIYGALEGDPAWFDDASTPLGFVCGNTQT